MFSPFDGEIPCILGRIFSKNAACIVLRFDRPQGEIYQWPRSRDSYRNHETTYIKLCHLVVKRISRRNTQSCTKKSFAKQANSLFFLDFPLKPYYSLKVQNFKFV